MGPEVTIPRGHPSDPTNNPSPIPSDLPYEVEPYLVRSDESGQMRTPEDAISGPPAACAALQKLANVPLIGRPRPRRWIAIPTSSPACACSCIASRTAAASATTSTPTQSSNTVTPDTLTRLSNTRPHTLTRHATIGESAMLRHQPRRPLPSRLDPSRISETDPHETRSERAPSGLIWTNLDKSAHRPQYPAHRRPAPEGRRTRTRPSSVDHDLPTPSKPNHFRPPRTRRNPVFSAAAPGFFPAGPQQKNF